jgi:hypothetical protein
MRRLLLITALLALKIRVDGEVWKESSSSGDYVIASCSGSVGSE